MVPASSKSEGLKRCGLGRLQFGNRIARSCLIQVRFRLKYKENNAENATEFYHFKTSTHFGTKRKPR